MRSSSAVAARTTPGPVSTAVGRVDAGDGAEVVEADLDRHRAPGDAGGAAAGWPRRRPGGRARGAASRGGGGRGRRSPRGRWTWAPGPGTTARSSRPRARRPGGRRWPRRAGPAHHALVGRAARSPTVRTPQPLEALEGRWGRRPTGPGPAAGAGRPAPRPAATTFTPSPGSGPRRPTPGLGRLRRQLGDELDGGHADRAGAGRSSASTRGPDRRRRSSARRRAAAGRPVTSRKASSSERASTSGVNEPKIAMHPPADLAVVVVVARHEDGVRAQALGPHRRHAPSAPRTPGPRSWRAATTPRAPVPPTMTGWPRSSGRRSSSTDAKNASMSTWRIVRVTATSTGG